MERDRRPRAFFRCLDGVKASVADDIHRRIQQAGVDLAVDRERAGWMAHVIVARAACSDIAADVRDAASHIGPRILVVTTERCEQKRAVWQLLHAGAGDVVAWDEGQPARLADCVAARLRRWHEVDALVDSTKVRDRLVGKSGAWIAAVRELVEVAQLPDVSVLLTGESGTGKELAARLIHDLDPRRDKRELVVLDCTTIVPTLSGSEFFGHERGAFTDAVTSREGAFFEADRGTLFLDELGELPMGLQAELLRVIQEGTYKRVGSSVWRQSRFRLVCATNRDLRNEVANGRFRADLYHRLAAWTVRLPPLGERPEDIPRLAMHFLQQLRPDLGEPAIDDAVLDVLLRRAYPGNVRELRQLVARLSGRHVGPAPITVGDLPADERPCDEQKDGDRHDGSLERWVRSALAENIALRDIRKAAEETAIAVALAEADGNVHRASRQLKVTDRALQMRRAAARKNGTES